MTGSSTRKAKRETSTALLSSFAQAWRERMRFAADRALAEEVMAEARPALESLQLALRVEGDTHPCLDHHEGLAMSTLLGRRLALLGATPAAAEGLPACVERAFDGEGLVLSPFASQTLRVAVFEGYVLGREEALARRSVEVTQRSHTARWLSERSRVLFLHGDLHPDDLEPVMEAFGRSLFNCDARSAVVDVGGLCAPSRGHALVVFAAHASARMLGARCIFSTVDTSWVEAAHSANLDVDELELTERFGDALRLALEIEGVAVRESLPTAMRRLLGLRR